MTMGRMSNAASELAKLFWSGSLFCRFYLRLYSQPQSKSIVAYFPL